MALALAQLYLEVEAGRRPRRHFVRLACPVLLARLAPVWVRPGPAGCIVALRGQSPTAWRYEAAVVVRRGERRGALALTLARRDGRWLLVEAVRPEDGPLPPPLFAFPPDHPDPVQPPGAQPGRLPLRPLAC